MKLIVFAHRKEASEVIKNLQMKSVSDNKLTQVYKKNNLILTITGEGIHPTMTKVSVLCSIYPITEIINYGVAANLTRTEPLHSLISIRTVYGEDEFKSFTTFDPKATKDCISAKQRVLTITYAKRLLPYATLCDRELWAIGHVAHTLKIPFRSFKLITDYADSQDACLQILQQAQEFSYRFWEHLRDNIVYDKDIDGDVSYQFPEFINENFYMTTAQRKKLFSLVCSLEMKYQRPFEQILEEIDFSFLSQNENKKFRTQILTSKLEALQEPFNSKVREKIDQLAIPLASQGIQFFYDKKLENTEVGISFRFSSVSKLKEQLNALSAYDHHKFIDLMNGRGIYDGQDYSDNNSGESVHDF